MFNQTVEEDDPYWCECIGGCGHKTNGSQYCCKTYCINDLYDSSEDEEYEKKNPNNQKVYPKEKIKEDEDSKTINMICSDVIKETISNIISLENMRNKRQEKKTSRKRKRNEFNN